VSSGPRHELVIFNDETHSFGYVVEVFERELGLAREEALACMKRIHEEGRWSFAFDREAAKRAHARVLAAGHDPRLAEPRRSLIAGVAEVDTSGARWIIPPARATASGVETLGRDGVLREQREAVRPRLAAAERREARRAEGARRAQGYLSSCGSAAPERPKPSEAEPWWPWEP
jgi:ATP-dependent Clp protease adapter protein ClpS